LNLLLYSTIKLPIINVDENQIKFEATPILLEVILDDSSTLTLKVTTLTRKRTKKVFRHFSKKKNVLKIKDRASQAILAQLRSGYSTATTRTTTATFS